MNKESDICRTCDGFGYFVRDIWRQSEDCPEKIAVRCNCPIGKSLPPNFECEANGHRFSYKGMIFSWVCTVCEKDCTPVADNNGEIPF